MRAIRILFEHVIVCKKWERGKNTYGESRQVFVCIRNLIPFERTRLSHDTRLIIHNTVFTRILATATINFSRAPVRLLIEGGSY